MKLPEDVAIEVAVKLKDMVRINGIKKLEPLHIDVACKLVHKELLFSSIQWCKYMRGDDDYV